MALADMGVLRRRLEALEAAGESSSDAAEAARWAVRAAYLAKQCEKLRSACRTAIPLLEEQRVWLVPPDGEVKNLDADDRAALAKVDAALNKMRQAIRATTLSDTGSTQ